MHLNESQILTYSIVLSKKKKKKPTEDHFITVIPQVLGLFINTSLAAKNRRLCNGWLSSLWTYCNHHLSRRRAKARSHSIVFQVNLCEP